ncbi:MAG: cytochrome-c oxidase, cbb3-type subunit III [Reyranella sp.]|nr:MAG: cytochrome-c oxidase, cbb3-type subunit III [Reyranella sp.]
MSVEQRDPHSGYLTTGHEWNGITELNTPVPRPVYVFLILTVVFSVVYWVLMPAWPLGSSFTKGLLGADDRAALARSIQQATATRSAWTDQIAGKSFAEIEADPRLMADVRRAGHTLFGDNCSVCHGRDARGGKGFPNLTTSSWLWGGSPEAIAETIRVGINAPHADSRVSQMPAFGRDGILKRDEMENVVAYVLSLSKPPALGDKVAAERITAGKAVFAANCVACHGAEAKGNPELGAPDLTDAHWIHGNDENSIYADVWGGLKGQMPGWEGRLTPIERKILVLYLIDLRSKRP